MLQIELEGGVEKGLTKSSASIRDVDTDCVVDVEEGAEHAPGRHSWTDEQDVCSFLPAEMCKEWTGQTERRNRRTFVCPEAFGSEAADGDKDIAEAYVADWSHFLHIR